MKGAYSAKVPQPGFWSGFLARQLRQWHWISSALCLALMLLFAGTGITLNHAEYFEAVPQNTLQEFDLSERLAGKLAEVEDGSTLPVKLAAALVEETGIDVARRSATIEFGEMAFDLGRPGLDAYFAIDLERRTASFEEIDRGTVSVLNDLHMGRDAGAVWGALIDFAAVICIVFCLTGFGLLWLHARVRPSTWPLTSLGLLAPFVAYILVVHI